ncbi:MAG TPA: amidohydrolase family protein [Vicinamibacterales bacterium]|nr:amidohydrolase family protein [Vicinamibacterales bacterium]
MKNAFGVVALALLAATAGSVPLNSQAPATGATVYEGGRVIVGDGSAPLENAAFVVEGSRITQVGRAGQVKAPAGATRVSLAGKTVMPAIIDTHTHMGDRREAVVDLLRRKAYFGVGAVLSLGTDPGDIAFKLRDERIPNGARLLTAGRGITMPEPGRSDVPYWVTTEAEARKAVQELAAQKADIVKIWVDDRNGKYKKLTPELYTAVIDEAHKHGLRVTVHAYYLDDAKGLLKAGVDAFAHGVRDAVADDEFMALVKQRPNFVLVPNLPDRGVAADVSWLADHVSPDEFKKLQAGAAKDRPAAQKGFAIQAQSLARMNAAGVTIALGTDGGIPWSHHFEMEDMVAAGMTPQQVIVAATANAAAFLRLEDHGTIAMGKSADFLVLDANPLDDITNTRRIADVYLRGARVDRAAVRSR